MTIHYTIFIFCFLLYYSLASEQFSSIVFKSDEMALKIKNNSMLLQTQLCLQLYENIVINEFVCIYPNNVNQSETKLILDSVQIVVDTILNNDNVLKLYDDNSQDFNIVYKNYLYFYTKSIGPFNNIIKNVLKYITGKFMEIYIKIHNYMQDKYTLDKENEEIILPITSKVRYFTNNTINKYDNCIDFINSLETSICFTTKIENIQKLSDYLK